MAFVMFPVIEASGSHLSVDIFENTMKNQSVKSAIIVFRGIVISGMCGVLAYYGCIVTIAAGQAELATYALSLRKDIFYAGTLGSNMQMIQGLPAVFDSARQAYEICSEEGSKTGELLEQCMEAKGFVIGARMVSTDSRILSIKPVEKYEDLAGMKILSVPSANIVATLNAMGAMPINFDVSDLSMGLQQKTPDAAYTSVSLYWAQKLFESAPYYLDIKGINNNVLGYVYSKVWLDSLARSSFSPMRNSSKK